MIRRLFSKFTRSRALNKARAEYTSAKARFDAAVARGDTRGQHDATRPLQAATTALLTLEVGR